MPLLETKGAASAQGFGLTLSSGPVNYIEDVFSTYLYTGNGSTQTITNGIDLSTKGGLVWAKDRDAANSNTLYDTVRGVRKTLYSNTTGAQVTEATNEGVYAFGTTGFSIGGGANTSNGSGNKIASWTFRKQPKFFDVVTFTAAYSQFVTVNHNIGSTPGFIIYKNITTSGDWRCWHRTFAENDAILLNTTAAKQANIGYISAQNSTSATFYTTYSNTDQYVAYFFAHNAGGFGLSGSDNVISCGSYTGNGSASGVSVNLGYEPQWVLRKRSDSSDFGQAFWLISDNMRGITTGGLDYGLLPNVSNAENGSQSIDINSTGFTAFDTGTGGFNQTGATYIYIAIRRGPMKVPTSGTSVYNATTYTGSNTVPRTVDAGTVVDMLWGFPRSGVYSGNATSVVDRLRGYSVAAAKRLFTASTEAESTINDQISSFGQTTFTYGAGEVVFNGPSTNFVNYFFQRAPSFFDVVCYTGTGSATTFNHNLGVAPELVIVKWRSGATGEDWAVMCTAASSSPDRRFLYLDLNAAGGGLNGKFADSSGTPVLPTATQVYIGTNPVVNNSAATYVAYLFATCAGVSKVGSYTGNGSSQTINCGFTGGARFVLIKRTDSTGDWYVWDTARGIVAGNDPHLSLNSTAAEVTTNDSIDTDSTGFIVNQLAATNINVSSATYIFLAIA